MQQAFRFDTAGMGYLLAFGAVVMVISCFLAMAVEARVLRLMKWEGWGGAIMHAFVINVAWLGLPLGLFQLSEAFKLVLAMPACSRVKGFAVFFLVKLIYRRRPAFPPRSRTQLAQESAHRAGDQVSQLCLQRALVPLHVADADVLGHKPLPGADERRGVHAAHTPSSPPLLPLSAPANTWIGCRAALSVVCMI